ncbi:MAG: DUF5131 family protein [Pseudonocardiaceae bacterium]
MSATTEIEWTDTTWNPVTGCTKVSPGCDHCYAEKITERFHGARPMHPDWAHALLDQWRAVGVAVFIKQLGSVWARQHHTDPKGGDWSRWPAALRVRDYPRTGAR